MTHQNDMVDTSDATLDLPNQQEIEVVRRSKCVRVPSKRLTDFVIGTGR